jgi:hypothetical protein
MADMGEKNDASVVLEAEAAAHLEVTSGDEIVVLPVD